MSEQDYYPAGSYNDPAAPWNETSEPERDFEVLISQTLSKTTDVTTNDYQHYVFDEKDDMGWHREEDIVTEETNWTEAYENSGHLTALELIAEFQKFLEIELARNENVKDKKRYEKLIEECKGWEQDEIEIMES